MADTINKIDADKFEIIKPQSTQYSITDLNNQILNKRNEIDEYENNKEEVDVLISKANTEITRLADLITQGQTVLITK